MHSILFHSSAILLLVSQTLSYTPPTCRFSPQFKEIDSTYINDLLYWEGKFIQDGIGYNAKNGMSYDGTLIDEVTGKSLRGVNVSGMGDGGHPFSAASKESLQVMVYAHAISGSPLAARLLSPDHPHRAPDIAYNTMKIKLQTYLQFNKTFPGYGGFLPWFLANGTEIRPTLDWVNRVPGLDNGELLWAVYAFVEAATCSGNKKYIQLGKEWEKWMDYSKTNAAKIFYAKYHNGTVCAVTSIQNMSLPVNHPRQNYSCQGTDVLNDPYEGELFTWWLYFFGGLSVHDRNLLWTAKRKQLVRVDYKMDGYGPVTVQKGYWFSSHEQWKFMEMPYLDIPLLSQLYHNAERVRTCNSYNKHIPGLYASVNNSTNSSDNQIIGYISNAGIPSIAFIKLQELDVATPYAAFPLILVDQQMGLKWWKNMVDGKRMQNPYGSSESLRIDGTATSSFVSWDSKITTVNALLGGTYSFVRSKMVSDGIYEEFIKVTKREYSRVFSKPLKGTHLPICSPGVSVPDKGLKDYTLCR